MSRAKQHLRVEYPDDYNPIIEYWEKIKSKPTLAEIEKLEREIEEAELKKRGSAFLTEKKERLEQLRSGLDGTEINVSWKVYKMYREIVRMMDDPMSEWEYRPKKGKHAIEFIENFCRHSKGNKGGQPFMLELWQKALVAATFGIVHKITRLRKYTEVLLIVGRKNGKSTLSAAIALYMQLADKEPGAEVYACAPLALDTKVPTLDGMKTMGTLEVGDYVFTPNGKPTCINYISPVVNYPTYKVTFDDGAEIIATGNHPWHVEQLSSNGKNKSLAWKEKDVTTQEIRVRYDRRSGTRIKVADPYECPDRNLPIPPYTLGAWLGDGRSNRGCLCRHEDDTEVQNRIEQDGFETSYMKPQNDTVYYTVRGLRTLLRDNELLDNKHIPEEYFFSSVGQRRELLKGLMDTDGSCSQTGECQYAGNNFRLVSDVLRLVLSLGLKGHLTQKKDQYERPYWHISFKCTKDQSCFNLQRKAKRQLSKFDIRCRYRYVTSVENIDPVPCRCISVDDESHLFVIGEELITTHNTKKDQAKVIWGEAKRMVKKSPVLLKRDKPLISEMVADFNDSVFKPLGRDSDTLDGLNVHCATMDEIHAWKDDNLYDVIVDGTSSREQPLIFITTTAGTIREHIYDRKYDEATNLINGFGESEGYRDEHMLALVYELDDRDEWTRPDCWVKANPGLGTIKRRDTLAEKVEKAKQNSMLVRNLLCKDFDLPETSTAAWLTFEEVNNTATFDVRALHPRYGIGGTDLSSTTDLTAAKVLFMVPDDPTVYQLSMYWIPEDLVAQRVHEDKIPYDLWIEKGYVRTCPGNNNHPKYVTEWFREVQDEYDIYLPWVGYDAWSAKYWVEEMQGVFGAESMIPVRQGKQTLSSPMKNLKARLQANTLNYNNNPVDKWCFCNTAVDIDKNDNIQPMKTSNARRRIDGTAATLDAFVVLEEKMDEYMSLI